MDKKIVFIVCVILCGILIINFLDSKLDETIRNQIVNDFNSGKDVICGDHILNNKNSHLGDGYFFAEHLIGLEITIKDCNSI